MGTKEQLAMLNNEFGIKSFLGADSYDRENYYLDKEQNELLIKNDTIEINGYIISQTDYRIESLSRGGANIRYDDKQLVIFTHECEMDKPEIREIIQNILYELINTKYKFSFKIT